MAIYAIGDLQGCYEPLRRLLDKLHFDSHADQLWFTGDLINRGPASLKTLRFVKSLGDTAISVLGNHDLHLLSAHFAGQKRRHKNDTIQPILDAKDCDELLDWLRHRPLLHYDPGLETVMVHAGIPPQWSFNKSLRQARKAEATLQSKKGKQLLNELYDDVPQEWSSNLSKWERRRFTLAALTRMRYVNRNGKLDFDNKGSPNPQQGPLMPWFESKNKKWPSSIKIVYGHWATLGLHEAKHTLCLDGGCVWGGRLVAAHLTNSKQLRYTKVRCS